MLTVTNADIWQARPALLRLGKQPWPMKTAYWLAKLTSKVNAEYLIVEQLRNELITRHGELNEQGVPFINGESEHWAAFATDHNELMAQTCEIDLDPVTLPDSAIEVTPEDIVAVESFVRLAA